MTGISGGAALQFDRQADGALKQLPAKHVDTGMGMERVTSVLQDKVSNYATDIFAPIFTAIQRISGAPEYTDRVRTPALGEHTQAAYFYLGTLSSAGIFQ